MAEARETAFHPITSKTAAGFSEEAGWLWVTSFGDVDAEYRAIREGVGMWDLSPLNKWDVTGPDALEAVQRVHTANIVGMDRGQVRYGAFVDEDGRVVDDGTVFRFDEEHLWVCTNSNEREEYFASATKGLDVAITYVAPDLPSMQIQGPRSRDLLRTITDADLDALRYFRFFPEQVEVGGVPVWLSRTGFSGELGYEVFLRAEHAGALWAAVEGAGAVPYGADVIEPIRVEVGMIVTDYDYDPGTRTPFDLGLDRFVALHERNMGTEALRAVAADPPNRFMTIRLHGDELPEYGSAVTREGEEVGVLTSPAVSPRHGPIGLAILRKDAAAPGTQVSVAGPDGAIAGTVDVLSIDDPAKERPRS
jgi:glycine cleavage system T protein (aminomethyltransferase)